MENYIHKFPTEEFKSLDEVIAFYEAIPEEVYIAHFFREGEYGTPNFKGCAIGLLGYNRQQYGETDEGKYQNINIVESIGKLLPKEEVKDTGGPESFWGNTGRIFNYPENLVDANNEGEDDNIKKATLNYLIGIKEKQILS